MRTPSLVRLTYLLDTSDFINHTIVVVDIEQSSSVLDLLHGKGHVPTSTILNGEPQNVTDATKQDDLSFIIVGNPMAVQLMTPFTEWKAETGQQSDPKEHQ